MTSVLPSPSDHLEMPKRMVGRRVVRSCSCGKPWPCDQTRWNRLREVIKMERDAQDGLAAEHAEYGRDAQSDRCYTEVKTLDWLLATMDRMEADQ